MRLAVISDIHANDVALRTALYDAAQCGADVYASLGDIVGYGPSPAESVCLARDSISVSILGNHDAAVCGLRGISDFSDYAAEAVRVQRGQLGPVEKTYLKLLPLVWHEGDVAMAHGDFTAPGEFLYIENENSAAANFAARPERIMFVGHTHTPCVWMFDETGSVTKLPPQNFKPLPNRRYIVNPGTVGFPRGGADVCGTYVIYDDKEEAVYFRKVPFDMNAYSRALRAVGRDVERSRAARRIRSALSTAMAVVLGVAALGVGALFFQKMAYDSRKRGVETERKYVEVVTTNRVVQVVDKVTITNYVIEVWANGKLKSSRTLDKPPVDFEKPAPENPPPVAPVADADDKLPVKPPSAGLANSMPVFDKSRPYTVITPAQSLALGGAYGGDEVRLIENPDGTCDIIHMFTRPGVTQPLLFPENNGIIPKSMRFLLVGGGGAGGVGGGWFKGGGAGGLVQKDGQTVPIGILYVFVGDGGGKVDGMDLSGEDTYLTLGSVTCVALGGGAGMSVRDFRGLAGGCGGGGYVYGGRPCVGKALQPLSRTGGNGCIGGMCPVMRKRNGGGGGGSHSPGTEFTGGQGSSLDVSGVDVSYAVGGDNRQAGDGADNSGNGGAGKGGPSQGFSVNDIPLGHKGGSGVAIIRYSIMKDVSFMKDVFLTNSVEKAERLAQKCMNLAPDANVRTAMVNGVPWCYFQVDGGVSIGCHGEKSNGHPDLWKSAVPTNALSGVVKIPEMLGGRRVVRIGRGAFQGCSGVTRFVVPEGVKVCEARAFARCDNLEEVVYPESIKQLGEGQVYRSLKVKRVGFKGIPPKSEICLCPFKGHAASMRVCVQYSKKAAWGVTGNDDVHVCEHGCHAMRVQLYLSAAERQMAAKTGAGFIRHEFKWSERGNVGEEIWRTNDGKNRLYMAEMYNTTIPSWSGVAYATMMFFNANQEVRFKFCIDNLLYILLDDDMLFGAYNSYRAFRSCRKAFPVAGWHRIVFIAANRDWEGGAGYGDNKLPGGLYYSTGNDKEWHRFESDPYGKLFRVTPADIRRAIADIDRAKEKKGKQQKK